MTSKKVDMSAPICLIGNQPNEKFVVREEALEILANIHQPLVVVAIAGLYRTGKSYLMNRLAGKTKGFSLGSTVQAETKGIWMWCLPHPYTSDYKLVLLDTEGLGDVEKGNPENDSWIFALATLLSSTLVYNSMHSINHTAFEKLQSVAELTKRIANKSGNHPKKGTSTDYTSFFPDFIWTVRDFSLQLEMNGRPISEDEYLENALQLSPDSTENCNMVKSCIRECFPSRNCFIFDRPVGRAKLKKLEDLLDDELEEEFVEKATSFCQHVWGTSRPMIVPGGHRVTGRVLAKLAKVYVDVINSGTVPSLESAVLVLAKTENSAAVREAVSHYEKQLRQKLTKPNDNLEELEEMHIECEREATWVFMARVFGSDIKPFQVELKNELNKKKEEYFKKNEQICYKLCQAKLVEVAQDFENEIRAGTYAVSGGFERFEKKLNQIKKKYCLLHGNGIQAKKVLQAFLESKKIEGKIILQTDKALTDKQKEIEDRRIQSEAARRKRERIEQEQVRLAAMLEARKKYHAKQLQRLKEEMENETKRIQEAEKRRLQEELKAMLRRRFLMEVRAIERDLYRRE